LGHFRALQTPFAHSRAMSTNTASICSPDFSPDFSRNFRFPSRLLDGFRPSGLLFQARSGCSVHSVLPWRPKSLCYLCLEPSNPELLLFQSISQALLPPPVSSPKSAALCGPPIPLAPAASQSSAACRRPLLEKGCDEIAIGNKRLMPSGRYERPRAQTS